MAGLQLAFLRSGKDVIFIDEYNVGSHIYKPYSWSQRGHEGTSLFLLGINQSILFPQLQPTNSSYCKSMMDLSILNFLQNFYKIYSSRLKSNRIKACQMHLFCLIMHQCTAQRQFKNHYKNGTNVPLLMFHIPLKPTIVNCTSRSPSTF